MDEKQKKYLKIFSIVLICGLLIGMAINYTGLRSKISSKSEPAGATETNWEGLLKLGLIPETESRPILDNDEILGIIYTSQNKYYLVRSKTLETGDFGKTFIVQFE